MRIIVFLEPTGRRGTKTEYSSFRKALVADGYCKVTDNLFYRVVPNRKAIRTYRKHIDTRLPNSGRIIMFTMTEKQWGKMDFLVGEKSYQEIVVGANCQIVL